LGYIIQVVVKTTPEADADIAELPMIILARLEAIIDRLERWPEVSGAKPLRGDWASCYRIRTGDWRVLFRIAKGTVIIVRVMHRSKVYED
jgi:mRNA-degrading endonuclease RelE of RelBE toxin-antitoxin system